MMKSNAAPSGNVFVTPVRQASPNDAPGKLYQRNPGVDKRRLSEGCAFPAADNISRVSQSRDETLSEKMRRKDIAPPLARERQCFSTVKDFSYMGGKFSGTLLDGEPYDGEVRGAQTSYKKFSGLVKEGALADEGGTRFQRPNTCTPFQNLLRTSEGPTQAVQELALNGYKYIKLGTDEKYDVTNDNERRVFEAYYEKYLLENVVNRDADALRNLSDNILGTYKSGIMDAQAIADWSAACNGRYAGDDKRLQQLVTQMDRAHDGISTLDIDEHKKGLLLDLYARRYINYILDSTSAYQVAHPKGIIKSKSNPLYAKRGRLDGGFRRADSMHMGIVRNTDKAPGDLRFSSVPMKDERVDRSLYTRCPDRLNMADPNSSVDRDPDSWLSYNFMRGMMPFVNGLSGSMLIEIRSMLYIKEQIKEHGLDDFLTSVDTLNNYFGAIAGLYAFIDGGHSLFEIQSAFKQTWVEGAFMMIFDGEEWADIGKAVYDDKEVFANAYRAAKSFDSVIQARKDVHRELEQHPRVMRE
jgi:hypothetical protein